MMFDNDKRKDVDRGRCELLYEYENKKMRHQLRDMRLFRLGLLQQNSFDFIGNFQFLKNENRPISQIKMN